MLVEDKISHREVTNQTASTEGLILLMKLYLLSMATVAVELFYPVVVHLVGALSLYHLDSFYGATSNAARLERAGGWLEIDYRIPFRQCVVRDGQRLFVPLMWSNKNGPRLKVLELLPDGSGRYTEEFPTEWLYEETTELVGYLPYVVLQCNKTNKISQGNGIKREDWESVATDNLIGVVPDYDPENPELTLLHGVGDATYLSSQDLIAAAQQLQTRPRSMPSHVGKWMYDHMDRWIIFRGWQFPHRYVGDPLVRRVHLFSRAMRQVPTGANQ